MSLGSHGSRPIDGSPLFGTDPVGRIETHDWSKTPLGPINGWPAALRVASQTVLASPFAMVLAWGPDLITIHNDAYQALFGADRQMLGRPFGEVWPEVQDVLPPLLARSLRGEPCRFHNAPFTLIRGGRESLAYFDFSLSPVRDETGKIVGVLNVCVETTERVAFENRLRDDETRLQQLNETLEQQVAERTAELDRMWDTSPDLMLVIDFDGYFRRVNPAWTKVLGYSADELIGHHVNEFVLDDDHSATIDAYEMAATGAMPTVQNKYRHKDGSVRWFAWVAAPAADMTYATGRDITAIKARETELSLAQEQLRQSQKMEAMGQLTGGVAHDFNNLLMPIIGGLDMLARRGVGTERDQRLIDGALQSAERAKTLVQRLLAFGRRQPLQTTAVDLTALVKDMAELLDRTLGPRVEVRVDLADDLPPVQADLNQLEMAILNVAVNARDAMPQGGMLHIGAERRWFTGEGPASLGPGHYVRLAMTDTGQGMDEETRGRAIEPFFSTKGVGKGTGLGLSMVHGLASQLGGGLTIDSTAGAGTSIALWLPISALTPSNYVPTERSATEDEAFGKALLVDDEELVRVTTGHMLIELGFDVVEAASAEEALKRLEEGLEPALVVTDHLMPGLSGADLARLVLARWPNLPVLIISGYADAEGLPPDLPRLTKPFRNAELAAQLVALGAVGQG